MKRYCVYILESERDKHYYVGSTQDLAQRIEFHNSPRARWTKRFQPWRVVHVEEFDTRGEAVKRELEIKRLKGLGKHLDQISAGNQRW